MSKIAMTIVIDPSIRKHCMCQSGQVQYGSLPLHFSLRACWNTSRASPFTLLGAIITPCTSILIVCTLSLLPALFPSLTDERALEMKRVTGLKGLLWLSSRFCTACFWQTQDWERARGIPPLPLPLSLFHSSLRNNYISKILGIISDSLPISSLFFMTTHLLISPPSNPRIV